MKHTIVQLLERKDFVEISFLPPSIPYAYKNPNIGDCYLMVILLQINHYFHYTITHYFHSIIYTITKTYIRQALTMPKPYVFPTHCPIYSKQTKKVGTNFIPLLQMSKQAQTGE